MPRFGFHASHELFSPSDLLRHVRLAEQAGFQAAMCSDHFYPWTPTQGESGYSFAWLGAALATTALPIGTICCPCFRYHPAIVAQATATLAEMFPGRVWLALGTGQWLNEHIVGGVWPSKSERQARVRESAEILRALWSGETVTRHGRVAVENARLYTRPQSAPRLFGAATTPETAAWVATWADGLLTVVCDTARLRAIVTAFREHGGEGKPMFLQVMVGYHADEGRAWDEAARSWPVAVLGQDQMQNVRGPDDFAALVAQVGPADLKGKLRVSSSVQQHVDWLSGDVQLGFDTIYLYNVSGETERFLEVFGGEVLQKLI